MSATHVIPWQNQLSTAIVNFPLWGRLRPSSTRGHAITALAFYDWAQGGLGVFACKSEVKSVGLHLYACAFTVQRFEGVFVDWKEGWCDSPQQSTDRFEEDAGRGKTVYSFSYGALSPQSIEDQRNALSAQDRALVMALEIHLADKLGRFNWQVWRDTAKSMVNKQATRKVISFVEPAALAEGRYLLPMTDPLGEEHVWPVGLSGDELCSYLGASSRESSNVDFFAFQERMDLYLAKNSWCVWDVSHSERLLKLFGAGNGNTHAADFFSVWDHDNTWPASSTRVIAPRFSQYTQSFVRAMQGASKDQLDATWIVASHFAADAKMFDMFDTVFNGLTKLDGSEELRLGDATFGLVGTRGERGCLTRMESPAHLLEDPALDALRQARAWCGGILSVDAALVAQAPSFWKTRFERREVAALLDESGNAAWAHPHFYYDKRPVDVPHAITMQDTHAFVEYSLFQENPRTWREREGGTLECAWGWKKCLDRQAAKYHYPIVFPTNGENNRFEDKFKWDTMRERWLYTMGAGEAAAVYGLLSGAKNWPIEQSEYKELAEHYLKERPALLALCEMMEFEAEGVLNALRTHGASLGALRVPTVESQDFTALMEPLG